MEVRSSALLQQASEYPFAWHAAQELHLWTILIPKAITVGHPRYEIMQVRVGIRGFRLEPESPYHALSSTHARPPHSTSAF